MDTQNKAQKIPHSLDESTSQMIESSCDFSQAAYTLSHQTNFLAQRNGIMPKFRMRGDNSGVLGEFAAVGFYWLNAHITRVDTKLATFLRK